MDQRLDDKNVNHRQHTGFNNCITKVGTTHVSDNLDVSPHENDNSDCSHLNSVDTLSINIGLSSPAESKQGLDHCSSSNPLYNRSSSTSSYKIPKRSGGGRKPRTPADNIPRPVDRRSYNQGQNQQHRLDPHQGFWRNNLESAQTTVTLANRWIVSLLHILLDTIKASAESRRIPSLHSLEYLPVFVGVQGSYIRRPVHRQRCSPDNLIDEEEVIKKRGGIAQTSIRGILDELHLHRETYNKKVTPRTQNSKNKKVMYVNLTSP